MSLKASGFSNLTHRVVMSHVKSSNIGIGFDQHAMWRPSRNLMKKLRQGGRYGVLESGIKVDSDGVIKTLVGTSRQIGRTGRVSCVLIKL